MAESMLSQVELKCMGIPDLVYHAASVDSLRKKAGIDPDSIEKAAIKLVGVEAKAEANTNVEEKKTA